MLEPINTHTTMWSQPASRSLANVRPVNNADGVGCGVNGAHGDHGDDGGGGAHDDDVFDDIRLCTLLQVMFVVVAVVFVFSIVVWCFLFWFVSF